MNSLTLAHLIYRARKASGNAVSWEHAQVLADTALGLA